MLERTTPLVFAGCLVLCSCGGEMDLFQPDSPAAESTETVDDAIDAETPPEHVGENDVRYFLDPSETLARFAGEEVRFDAEYAFRSVTLIGTGALPALEYAVVRGEEQTDWRPVGLDEYDDGFWNGVITAEGPSDGLLLRGDAPRDFVRLEFFEEPVAIASAFDDAAPRSSEEAAQQSLPGAISRPGRWALSSRARRTGESQYLPYTGAYGGCSGRMLPGARSLGRFLVNAFPGARTYQGYNCRTIRGGSGLSMHAVGRAVDVFIPTYGGQADNDLGDPVGNYLVEHAEDLGIQFIIWDRTKWNASYSGRKDRYYGGAHPHHDHLHIELTPNAASRSRTHYPRPSGHFDGSFADDDGTSYEPAIEALKAAGIAHGCSNDGVPRFCPSAALTRAQMAALLDRALDLPAASRDYFGDDDESLHEGAINRIAEAGITQGCDDGRNFCPSARLRRGQLAVFLVRAFDLPAATWDYFGDDEGLFTEPAMNALREARLTAGCSSGKGCPTSPVNRGQAAVWLARALDLAPLAFKPFYRDDEGHRFENDINRAKKLGLMNGCTATKFCPGRRLTRAETATVLMRGLQLEPSTADRFSDDDASVHEPAIDAIAEAGITSGCRAGQFCPGTALTRGQLAILLARALELPPAGDDYFDDDDGLYYEDAANRIAEAGITSGCSAGEFCGGAGVSRAQGAHFFVRAFE